MAVYKNFSTNYSPQLQDKIWVGAWEQSRTDGSPEEGVWQVFLEVVSPTIGSSCTHETALVPWREVGRDMVMVCLLQATCAPP